MRIERIVLRNYRQFRQAQFTFRRRPDTDLHFVIGTNGTGKTNLLNAINWCLYGDEPHLSKDSQHLPLVNLKTVAGTDAGRERDVAVEVWTETEDGARVEFTRKATFRKHSDGHMERQRMDFGVRFQDERGNTKMVAGEDADVWVERFVPAGIREFFFFDGERLDNYFRDATGQNIRHAVFQISQLDLLENRVERKLQDILDGLRKEAGKTSPGIEDARIRLEEAQSSLAELERQVEECETQIAIAKSKIAEYGEKLKGVPDVEALEDERQQLVAGLSEGQGLLEAKEDERRSLLLECGTVLMLWPAIRSAAQVIEEKRRNQEIPPPVGRWFLDEVLQSGTCGVCGRVLDDGSAKRVRRLRKEVQLSSEAAIRLMQMETSLRRFAETARGFEERIAGITREIDGHRRALAGLSERVSQIDRQMAGYDAELVREWFTQRTQFEEVRDRNQELLGGLRMRRQQAGETVEEAEEQLDTELKKEKKIRELTKKVTFCERALDVVRSTHEVIMRETRERIEGETKRRFFGLVWKTGTFADVKIGADYGISLIHSMGYECLGSVSAGERELLALAFTLALHQASGFDSPILIDTPVARISDVNRENFARVLSEVSTSKQIILLFTPNEYSKEVSSYLSGRASGKYSLGLSSDEKEARVEVR